MAYRRRLAFGAVALLMVGGAVVGWSIVASEPIYSLAEVRHGLAAQTAHMVKWSPKCAMLVRFAVSGWMRYSTSSPALKVSTSAMGASGFVTTSSPIQAGATYTLPHLPEKATAPCRNWSVS